MPHLKKTLSSHEEKITSVHANEATKINEGNAMSVKKPDDLGSESPAGPAAPASQKPENGYWPGWKVKVALKF